jgi:hypothetical protein
MTTATDIYSEYFIFIVLIDGSNGYANASLYFHFCIGPLVIPVCALPRKEKTITVDILVF